MFEFRLLILFSGPKRNHLDLLDSLDIPVGHQIVRGHEHEFPVFVEGFAIAVVGNDHSLPGRVQEHLAIRKERAIAVGGRYQEHRVQIARQPGLI